MRERSVEGQGDGIVTAETQFTGPAACGHHLLKHKKGKTGTWSVALTS